MGVIQVRGAKEIEAKFRQMGTKGATKYAQTALRAGGKVFARAGKAIAPIRRGLLRKSIAVKVGKSTKDTVVVKVGPRRRLFKKNNAFYAAFVDLGHFLGRRIRKKLFGKYNATSYQAASVAAGRRFVPGKHFMEATFSAKHSEAEKVVTDTMLKLIDQDLSA